MKKGPSPQKHCLWEEITWWWVSSFQSPVSKEWLLWVCLCFLGQKLHREILCKEPWGNSASFDFYYYCYSQTYSLCNVVLKWVTQVSYSVKNNLFVLNLLEDTVVLCLCVFVVVWERGIIIPYLSFINTLFQMLLRKGGMGLGNPHSGNSGDSVLQQEGRP